MTEKIYYIHLYKPDLNDSYEILFNFLGESRKVIVDLFSIYSPKWWEYSKLSNSTLVVFVTLIESLCHYQILESGVSHLTIILLAVLYWNHKRWLLGCDQWPFSGLGLHLWCKFVDCYVLTLTLIKENSNFAV